MAAMAKSSLLLVAVTCSVFFPASALHSLDVANVNSSAVAVDGAGDATKVYIVFTERQPAAVQMPESNVSAAIESFHYGLLTSVLDGGRTLHGFAARLTEQEKNRLAAMDAVLSVHEKVVYRPQTTRSWNFLSLPQYKDAAESLPFERDVIIGMVDTGVWPESESFSDHGLPPPPAKWKGVCSKNFTACNNKIIGARAYKDGVTTFLPRDEEGHGTHTASTAAGVPVRHASLGGLAAGTARGAVPAARLAIYKVCWAAGRRGARRRTSWRRSTTPSQTVWT
ncbi:hypothetical protein GUJ93_ZPchr0013g37927 [Zizania palustris]|uniref:Peptidase S8/S53 domain-containing protein n=1 Tax=Zizania palustris TaxID=103762 RepID=A0A8J5WZC8_ZIZPA|nr:hypothetical protein GUJ93_ZPchr0013g37927 [Zizania palustris]